MLEQAIAKFQDLAKVTGTDKMSSYQVTLAYGLFDKKWSVDLGTYDIADWPRHTYKDGFQNLEEVAKYINEITEKAIQEIQKEDD